MPLHDSGDPTSDTIVAIATAPGRGGIGIVRLSGSHALAVARHLTTLKQNPAGRHARHIHVLDQNGGRLDDALLTWFPSPHSYTGEEVVEIATHGAPVILQAVVERALHHGARLARAGEFTERAFLNRRLDLTQAEAIRDLIEAQTLTQARMAAEQLGGSLARSIRPVKQQLVELVAMLEAGIDFAEDDLETIPAAEIARRITDLVPPLEALLQSYAHGRLLREGLRIALIGKPNAGKSSLFNRLLERERAIVTPVAGTTRDVVSERTAIQGIPVELLDTAGLRDTQDEIERLGVARSHEAAAEADLVLQILDARDGPPGNPPVLASAAMLSPASVGLPSPACVRLPDADLVQSAGSYPEETRLQATQSLPSPFSERALQTPALVILNKADLLSPAQKQEFSEAGHTLTSALTGEGIEQLRQAILTHAGAAPDLSGSAPLSNLRQHDTITRCLAALHKSQNALAASVPHEMLLLDLYEALHALDELTGETTPESILNLIFSTFCIGK